MVPPPSTPPQFYLIPEPPTAKEGHDINRTAEHAERIMAETRSRTDRTAKHAKKTRTEMRSKTNRTAKTPRETNTKLESRIETIEPQEKGTTSRTKTINTILCC
jgi:hypothetical protein